MVSLNRQLSDQFSPISSTAAASGSGFFCLLRPAASSLVGTSAMAWVALGMARDHLHRGQLGSPGCVHACGLSAWRAWAARQSCSSLLTFLSFPRFPSNSDLHHLAWVHRFCYRRDPAQAVVIRCSAQLLMFFWVYHCLPSRSFPWLSIAQHPEARRCASSHPGFHGVTAEQKRTDQGCYSSIIDPWF